MHHAGVLLTDDLLGIVVGAVTGLEAWAKLLAFAVRVEHAVRDVVDAIKLLLGLHAWITIGRWRPIRAR